MASRKISREEINCPLGSDKTPILLSKEALVQLLHEFNAVWAAGTKPAEKVNVTQAPSIAERATLECSLDCISIEINRIT